MTSLTPSPAKPATFPSKKLLRLFPIQHPRVSVSRNRGAKFKIKNPRVSVSTPYSCRGRERGEKFNIQNRRVSPLIPPRVCAPTGVGASSLNPLTPRYCVGAFTLVELLAVIGIMGLLAAVGVPALKGLTGSGGRKQALSQVMGAIEIARNTAISTGTNAAVIFPDSTFASGDAYKYRSMAVVAWNPTNTNLPATMVGSWIVLPQGVALFPNSISALPTATNISVRILTTTKTANFPGIVFQSDGGLSEDLSQKPTNGISLFEGTVNNTTTNPTSKMTNFETVRLTRYTGRTLPTLAPAP